MARAKSENLESRAVSPKFYAHLKKLNAARRRTAETIEKYSQEGRMAEAAVSVAWELLFDFFAKNASKGLELSELNTLAGVIQKLASGEIKSLSTKAAEQAKSPESGLSEEGVRRIEQMLKLL